MASLGNGIAFVRGLFVPSKRPDIAKPGNGAGRKFPLQRQLKILSIRRPEIGTIRADLERFEVCPLRIGYSGAWSRCCIGELIAFRPGVVQIRIGIYQLWRTTKVPCASCAQAEGRCLQGLKSTFLF